MEDLIKTLVNAPTNSVLVLAGLAFLGLAVLGRLSDRLDPGPKGRLASGALGAVLLVLGLLLPSSGARRETDTAASAPPAAAPAPSASNTGTDSTAQQAAASSVAAVTPAAGAYPLALAAGQVVKREGRTYTILKMQLDENDAKELSLAVTARMTNDDRFPANFWNDNFRLLVDGVPRAPVGTLNELVEAHAAKEGIVTFAVPKDAKSVALQIDRFGTDAPGIAIALPGK